ncbi:MAG: hypothetical protein M3144_03610, partial [Actinomycetota bacterium]|nr:hypothetical protein [Actinomycetota bacterium]
MFLRLWRDRSATSLQSKLDEEERLDDGAEPPLTDPVGVLLELESSQRFHRDAGLGRIFHLGRISFRENRRSDSLHISVQGNRIAAHIDRLSPLGEGGERPSRYSLRRAVAHNVSGMAHDLFNLVRGRQGDHRSELDCEWLWDPSQASPDDSDLLDPKTSAWSVQLEARVRGVLDEDRLRAAVAAVAGDRPSSPPVVEVVECPDDASLEEARARLQTEAVRFDDSPPLRARLARHPDGDVLMLNLNHAATDGFGALRVLDCIAAAYAGRGAPDPPLDFLAVWDLPVRPASAPVSRVMGAYRAQVERLRDKLARPARLVPDGSEQDPGYGFHLVSLSAEQTRQVIDFERPAGSPDTLLTALHLAIGEWNLARGAPGRRVGVLGPINLRSQEWPEEKIGNFSVTARVSTSRRHRSGYAAARKATSSQTDRNKRTRTGIALIAALERTGLLPLWCKQSLIVLQPVTRNRRVDTALLSDLGWLEGPPSFGDDAGDAAELWYSVPARSPLAV